MSEKAEHGVVIVTQNDFMGGTLKNIELKYGLQGSIADYKRKL